MDPSEFLKSFDISIQLGAILAVLALYWRSLLTRRKVFTRVLFAFFPTALLGAIFYKFIKRFLLSSSHVVLWSLFAGGVLLILFERWHRENAQAAEEVGDIPYRKCFLIGLFQAVAMIPGVSRSAATIVGGLALGLKRQTIVEFSFLLAVPTMLGATVIDWVKNGSVMSGAELPFLLVGFLTSFGVAVLGIKFFLRFIKNHSLVLFGIYRIAAAFFFWAFVG